MADFEKALVVTHIVFRKAPPYDALEGPYSSVCNSLKSSVDEVLTCQIPITGFKESVIHGEWEKTHQLKIPTILGEIPVVKYLVDIFIVIIFAVVFSLKNKDKRKLIVGVDPLSCFPLTFLKKIFGFKLVFYSVDFNHNRFQNRLMQKLYEKADEFSTRFSNQTWVVCQSLKDYKEQNFKVNSIYIPNSSIFNAKFYLKGKKQKTGNKMA